MTTRFKRLLWKTAIKLHKQTQGDKTSLKRQKQHKETQNHSKRTWESQNTKNTGYRRQRQQWAVLSASWEILQLSVQQHSSGMFRVTWSSLNRETNHICVHATDAYNHIFTLKWWKDSSTVTAGFMYFPASCGLETSCVSIDFSIFQRRWCGWNETCWHTGLTC